jgi:putative sugar O-methyltransferase
VIQTLISQIYRLLDVVQRLIVYRLLNFKTTRLEKEAEVVSDSQATPYEQEIQLILETPKKLEKFRRNFMYREIVESVSYSQGKKYIERINFLTLNSKIEYEVFKKNDSVGSPRLSRYPLIGKISPTTLRYISVGLEIQKLFGENLTGKVVEIGAGYGGQASVLQKFFKISLYGIYDLRAAQDLVTVYLSKLSKNDRVKMLSLDEIEEPKWDLAISNYAFSELPTALQKEYINKVFRKSERGYLIMNSGGTNNTGRSDGKLTLQEMRGLLPDFELLEEVPKTGPDNYVIVWGHK